MLLDACCPGRKTQQYSPLISLFFVFIIFLFIFFLFFHFFSLFFFLPRISKIPVKLEA